MSTERDHRHEIVRIGKLLHSSGMVAATDGNISIRIGDDRILSTPTAMSKGLMSPEDLVVVDCEGGHISGERSVSSEIGMHLLIYRMRPDIREIVHAHPPTATGFAAAGMALDQPLCSEMIITLGAVPLARYGTPGTSELAHSLEPLIPHHCAILMANHGVVTYGADLQRAFMCMETVEHFAKITLVTHLLGRQTLLNDEQVGKLRQVAEQYVSGGGNGSGRAHASELQQRVQPVTAASRKDK